MKTFSAPGPSFSEHETFPFRYAAAPKTLNGRQEASFSGHETFPFRYGWLKKGVDALRDDPDAFIREEAPTLLGVGKNMVKSIRHWCLATGLVREVTLPGRVRVLQVSPLGELLVGSDGYDPYLEDPATLWLLHWNLASAVGRSITWHWAFNEWRGREFTRKKLTASLQLLAQVLGARRAKANTIKRDVDCFIRSYVPARSVKSKVLEDTLDCPLVELGLIVELGDGESFRFQVGPHPSLPNTLLAYCICEFWERLGTGQHSLAFEQLAHAVGSPGRVFKLSEADLLGRLEQLETLTGGCLVFDETAGLKQVYRRKALDKTELLQEVYAPATPLRGRNLG